MGPEQTVSEMAMEVLERQARTLADRSGRPVEDALAEVRRTAAGRRLRRLAEGPHRHERAAEWQAGLLEERLRKEWAKGKGAPAKYREFLEEELGRLTDRAASASE